MKTSRTLAALLAALLLSSTLAACAGNENPSDTAAGADSSAADTTEAIPAETEPTLAFEKQNHGGAEYSFLTCVEADYEYRAEEQTGDRVNDAIYARNKAVEDYLGIKLMPIYESGSWSNRAAYNALITNAISAGDKTYSFVTGMISCIQPLASSQLFYNLFDVPGLDMDNPWWVSTMQDELALKGKLFGIIGDTCLSMYKGLSVVFFNQNMIEANEALENPYELVKNGTWTLDKYLEQTSGHGVDLNGDGTWTIADDSYSIVLDDVVWRSMNAALDIHSVKIDENGVPVIVDPDEKLTSTVDKLQNYLFTNQDVFYIKNEGAAKTAAFSSDRAIYYLAKLEVIEDLSEMESDFGIIPMPKYDENQKDYYTQVATATQMIFIPVTTSEIELTGQVLEALSYYSYMDVVGTYYDTALKQRYSRDSETAEMLDLIRQGAVNGFDYSYSTAIAGNPWVNKTVSSDGSTTYNVASAFASNRTVWETNIQKILENYEDVTPEA